MLTAAAGAREADISSAVPRGQHGGGDLAGSMSAAVVQDLISEHRRDALPRLRRLWDYFRNPARDTATSNRASKGYTLAQESGLPARLTGVIPGAAAGDAPLNDTPRSPREIVIENDIAWRVHTLVDFMVGKPLSIRSLAPAAALAAKIDALLAAVFEDAGGSSFFHDLALLGTVYGFVDVLLRVDAAPLNDPRFALELIEPPRAIPVLNSDDYRRLDAFVVHFRRRLNRADGTPSCGTLWERLRDRLGLMSSTAAGPAASGDAAPGGRSGGPCEWATQVWTPTSFAAYRSDAGRPGGRLALVERSLNRLGRVPVVHIQNLPQPFCYAGLSDVEPLIPLQDELNTRLCDRANRVTFQSFKMYLGKGIEKFIERPVGPGQMWATDNEAASIQEFGGDAASPSEDAHITELREALDKASGVTPVAAGIIRDKIGNLTSENALRVVLMGLLAKTEKKRTAYGHGIAQVCELILHAADVLGVLRTTPAERRVRIDWPPLLPDTTDQKLREAKLKLEIGVPREQVLAELGYPGTVE